jgi:hypothetical protein
VIAADDNAHGGECTPSGAAWSVAISGVIISQVAYRIDYGLEARIDLREIGKDRSGTIDAIEAQLRGEPTKQTRNRVEADPNPFGRYELRVQPYRVYYNVDEDTQTVRIEAVIYKPRETAHRRGREVETRE